MKRKKPYLLAGLVLLLFLLCTACGNTEGQIAPQDDPNEGLGGGLSEDTVNDFSGFEGIWLGEADNDYDSMEFDAEGNWTLYLSGEVVDDGYLRYEPEWEAIYAYSSSDDSGSLITMEEGQLYSAAYGYFNYGEGMEYLWYEDGGHLTEDDVRTIAKESWPENARGVTIENVQKYVEKVYDVSHEDLVGPKRVKEIMMTRHVAIWLCRELCNRTLADIGKKFGGRSHATIKHSIHTIEELAKDDKVFFDQLQRMKEGITSEA